MSELYGYIFAAVILVGLGIWYKTTVYNECRLTHSRTYCFFMVNH